MPKNADFLQIGLKHQTYQFKCQPHKKVKHTQTIRRFLSTNYLNVFDHFMGLALKGLNYDKFKYLVAELPQIENYEKRALSIEQLKILHCDMHLLLSLY